ncbi:MAG: DNA repair protein RecO [Treponema sp.]|nr:DNA repair protein RecO [Treponema sp.]
MARNLCYTGLILRSRPSGEANREIWLLTAEAGLIRVTVFGGPKSRLRAYASPFHSGRVWIYHDPVKDTRKLSDFDVHSWRPGLRELYERAMAADTIAETILASHGGGGNWEDALSIAETALDALALADDETCARIVMWFFWQWIDFLGLRPEFASCSSCGKATDRGAMLRFSPKEGVMICTDCCGNETKAGIAETSPAVGPGCRHWLETVHLLTPDQLFRHTLDKPSFREAHTLVTAILTEALGKRIAGWDHNSVNIK